MKREPIISKTFTDHLIITFPIMLICWIPCIILGVNGITQTDYAWINIPCILGAFSTTIASYIALKKNGEVTGFKEWLKHVFDFKHSVLGYLLGVGLAAVQALLMCLIGGYEKTAPVYMIVLMLPIMLIGGGLEEAGWRYITFPELDKKFGFIASAFITGIIWAVWHLPLFYIPGVNQYGQSFLFFTVNVIGLSFILAAVRKITGSVWLCVLCHMTVNAIPEVFRYDFYGKASIVVTVIMVVVSVVLVRICETKRTDKKRERDDISMIDKDIA